MKNEGIRLRINSSWFPSKTNYHQMPGVPTFFEAILAPAREIDYSHGNIQALEGIGRTV